jgi:hypothetical protein
MPSPSVPENVNKIFTKEFNHFIKLSSPLQNSSNARACLRNTFRTASGESQVSSTAANGGVCRSSRPTYPSIRCFMSFLYSFEGANEYIDKIRDGTYGTISWLIDFEAMVIDFGRQLNCCRLYMPLGPCRYTHSL